MTNQALNQLEADKPRLQLRDILPGPGWAPTHAGSPAPSSKEEPPVEPANRGKPRWVSVLATACMEIAIPVGVIAIWQLWMHAR